MGVSEHVDAGFFPTGTLEYYQTAWASIQTLETGLLEALLNGKSPITPAFMPGDEQEALVVDLGPGGGIGGASELLVELLIFLRHGAQEDELISRFSVAEDMSPDAFRDVLSDLVSEALIAKFTS